MSKYSRVTLIVLTLIPISLILFSTFVGRILQTEVANFAEVLIQRDDVTVTQFNYNAGAINGRLEYDFVWRPMKDEYLGILEIITQLDGLDFDLQPQGGFRFKGSQKISQGPFVGGRTKFALARTDFNFELPEVMRSHLPQYPGKTPLLNIEFVVGFSGKTKVFGWVPDYNGRLIDVNGRTEAHLKLLGLSAEIEVNREFKNASLKLDVKDFSLEVPSEEFYANVLNFTASSNQAKSHIGLWVGRQNLAYEKISFKSESDEFTSTGGQITITDATSEGTYSLVSSTKLNSLHLPPFGSGPINMTYSIQLDSQVVSDLRESFKAGGLLDYETILGSFSRILEQDARFDIERLALSLASENDVFASLSLTYTGISAQDAETNIFEQIVSSIGLVGKFDIQHNALLALLRSRLSSEHGDSLGARSLEARAQLELAELLDQFQDNDWFNVLESRIEGSIQMQEGRLQLNGVEVFDVLSFAALFGDVQAPTENAEIDDWFNDGSTIGSALDSLQYSAEPLWPAQILRAGFTPDPIEIELIAGGTESLTHLLDPQCAGYVTASQPDVVVDYTAGTFDLFIYVSASDDTTLAIRAPDGQWFCNDDAPGRGLNPGLRFVEPRSGRYAIWVGNYSSGTARATLFISELGMN